MGRESCSKGYHNAPLSRGDTVLQDLIQDKPDRWRRHIAILCQDLACCQKPLLGDPDLVPHGVDDLFSAGVQCPMLDVIRFQIL